MSFARQLARMRVAAETGVLPRDLARWALAELAAAGGDEARRELRDHLLRQAAGHLTGSTWARAHALRAELVAMPRRRDPRGAVRELLVEVLALDPDCPRSHRQLLRIIGGDTDDRALSPQPDRG
jgi:hypothetical protein